MIFRIIFGPILLLIWLIINTIYFIKKMKNLIKDKNKNTKLIVECEICKNEHEASIDEFFSTFIRKSKSTTFSANAGPIGATGTHYNYFAKKFYCPKCTKKTWSIIKNYNDLAINNTKTLFPYILKYFIILIIGGYLIMFITKLFV